MDPDIKENVKNVNHWIRGLFILLFVLILGVAKIVTGAVVLLQFGHTLFTADTNPRLQELGANLAAYITQIILFLTYNTDEKPWPFEEWPGAQPKPVTTRKKAAKKKSSARKKSDDDEPPTPTEEDKNS